MLRTLATGLFCALFTWSATAATLENVTFPDRYPIDGGQTLPLNGIGLRTLTILRVKVYVAALYLAEPSHDAQQILKSSSLKVLVLHFLHSGSKEEIQKEFRLGEMNNCGQGQCSKSDEADFERLVADAPGVAVGDTSTYMFNAKGFRVLANNKLIGEYANPDLGERVLAGFIGDHPPSAELRAALLGQHE